METITIHWSSAFALPLLGAFVARQNHTRWQAWAVAAGMSLIGALMIVFLGHGTFEYAMVVLAAMWLVGALLPEIWHWVRGFVQRRAGWFIGAGILLGLYVIIPGILYYLACLGVLAGAAYMVLGSVFRKGGGGKKR
jgi:hypothetical protein